MVKKLSKNLWQDEIHIHGCSSHSLTCSVHEFNGYLKKLCKYASLTCNSWIYKTKRFQNVKKCVTYLYTITGLIKHEIYIYLIQYCMYNLCILHRLLGYHNPSSFSSFFRQSECSFMLETNLYTDKREITRVTRKIQLK